MVSASDEPTPVVYHIGSDRVMVRDDRLVIESPVDMALWEVRTYRHTLINFNGRRWRGT